MISYYFGVVGSGKSTVATMLAIRELKRINKGKSRYKRIYSNFPIPNCYTIDTADIGKYDYSDALILIDEASICYNNRNYKAFPKDAIEWFKLHRHYHCDIAVFSQGWDDVDKVIRTLASKYYMLKKRLWFTFIREIRTRVEIDDVSKQPVDAYYIAPVFGGGLKFCYRPFYYKFFDSYSAPVLPANNSTVYQSKDES